MFKHLKSNGFDLESLHVQKDYKIQMMIATLVLAYTLSVVYGLKEYKRRITIKKHGSAEMSVFRYGLDKWQNHLQNFVVFLEQLLSFVSPINNRAVNQMLLLKQNVP